MRIAYMSCSLYLACLARYLKAAFSISFLLLIANISHADVGKIGNPHYNKIGFFDMHVCNWPERPIFFKALFSTTHYNEISKIDVFDNNKHLIGKLDLNKYRRVMLKKPKKEKRVFIKNFEIPKTSGNGWYSTKVYLKNGKILTAKDYVIIYKMPRAKVTYPKPGADLKIIPTTLKWETVHGAKYYQVFIEDIWNGKHLYTSDLLTKPFLVVPKGLLKHNDSYCWRIHARDTNEDVLLGDFNHGSLTKCFEFDID